MSKVTDSWKAFEDAQARETRARREADGAAAALEMCELSAQTLAAQIVETEAGCKAAKLCMVEAADALTRLLDYAANATVALELPEAWANYEAARDYVSERQEQHQRVLGRQSDNARSAVTLKKACSEAAEALHRTQKFVRDAAAELRRLIPSEVAGYCGKLAPKADGEQSLLSSEAAP